METFDAVHVAGSSAGGYLAIVTSHLARRAGISIEGMFIDEPMLGVPLPGLDTSKPSDSYRVNSQTRIAAVRWLEWSWDAYLGLLRNVNCELGVSTFYFSYHMKPKPKARIAKHIHSISDEQY